MPPSQLFAEPNFDGYWGMPTATIDWCEANYEVTFYVAEFWNTISNIVMIIPPLIGAIISYKDDLEARYTAAYICFLLVGIGSWSFHGTLLYEMQLLDELPMIWLSSFLIYMFGYHQLIPREVSSLKVVAILSDELPFLINLDPLVAYCSITLSSMFPNRIEVDSKPKSSNLRLQVLLALYCSIVTLIYVIIKKPIFHEVAYGLMVVCLLKYSIDLSRKMTHSKALLISSCFVYVTGFIIWNIDNHYCSNFRQIRHNVGYPVKPVLQGHAWWHLFAGSGTYLFLLYITHARANYLHKKVIIKSSLFGIYPYMRVYPK